MSNETIRLTDATHQYLIEATLRESELLCRLRTETAQFEQRNMQIAPEQGQFMALLVEMLGACRALEVGTFTGYSALCMASALPPDGLLVCCDVSAEWTAIAQRYWQEAGLAGRIDLRLAPALETLDALLADGQAGTFDFAFIDADKTRYDDYYEHALALLRVGGVVAIDNALSDGRVVTRETEDATAIDALNRKIHADERVSCSLVPIGDGLMLARKR